jgi:hypothetical protein
MAGVVGKALRGFGRALKGKSKSKWTKDKAGTITGVKPMSGKVPHYIGAAGKNPERRKNIVRTHFSVKRSDKLHAAEKKVKEGKSEIKKMLDTGQAEEYKNYKGEGTGVYRKKGFAKGGHVNTSRENRLEELGRVDAEKAYSSKGKRNLKDEKKRIVKELS